jgi:hypothetical protein
VHLIDDLDENGTRGAHVGLLLEPVPWMRDAACAGMGTEESLCFSRWAVAGSNCRPLRCERILTPFIRIPDLHLCM